MAEYYTGEEYIFKAEFNEDYGLQFMPTGESVVRCKDCKHCITHEEILFCGYMGNIGEWRYRTETDFCSRGERKDEVQG